jgi:hypothetical protein
MTRFFCDDGSGFPEPPLCSYKSNPRHFRLRPRPAAVSRSWCGIRLQLQAEPADLAGAGFPGFRPAPGLGARRRHGQWAVAAHGGGRKPGARWRSARRTLHPPRKNSPPPKEGYLPHPPPERLQKEAQLKRFRMVPVAFMHPPARNSSRAGQHLPCSKSFQRVDREGLDPC